MNREDLLNEIRNCMPSLGCDNEYPKLFGKYGMSICGIYDGWLWFREDNITEPLRQKGCLPLTNATNEELFEMLIITYKYWLEQYKQWYNEAQEKSSKLDQFISECEIKYFGYDEDGYTDKTIDRIFTSIFKILDKQ